MNWFSAHFNAGFIGMALSYGLSLNMSLVFSIQNQCILANQIISVERLNQYMHVSSEAPEVVESNRPAPDWPTVGRVELQDLKVSIKEDTLSKFFSDISHIIVFPNSIGIILL